MAYYHDNIPNLNTQSCIKGLLVVSGLFGQPGQYIKKSWGPIMSVFFMFSGSNKKKIENTIAASALKSFILNFKTKKWFFKNSFEIKQVFFYSCVHSQMWMYYIKVSFFRTGSWDCEFVSISSWLYPNFIQVK